MNNCYYCGYKFSANFLKKCEIHNSIICPNCEIEFKIPDNKLFFSYTKQLIDLIDNVKVKVLELNYIPIDYKGKFDIKISKNDAIQSCFSNIKKSDFFTIFIDKSVGTIIDEENQISIIEQEFNLALEEDLQIIVFIREEVYAQVKPYKEQKLYEVSEEEFRSKGFAAEKNVFDLILRLLEIRPKVWIIDFMNAQDIINGIENKWGIYELKKNLFLETEISNLIEVSILKDYVIKLEWEKSFISWQGEEPKVPDTLTIENFNDPINLDQEPSDWVKEWENKWNHLLKEEELRNWYKSRLKLLINGIRGLMYNSLSDSLIIIPPPKTYFQLIWNKLDNLKKAAVFSGSGKGKSKFMLYLAAFWKKTYNGLVFLINNPNLMEERHWNIIERILSDINKNILLVIDDLQNISEASQTQIKRIVELRDKSERGKDWWLVGFTIQSLDFVPKSTVTKDDQLLKYKYWGFNSQEITLDKVWSKWKDYFKVWWMWLSHIFEMINNKKAKTIQWEKINAPWEIAATLGGLNEKIKLYFETHIIEKTLYTLCASLFLLNNEKVFGREDLELLVRVGPQRTKDQLKEISNQSDIKLAIDFILNKWQLQKDENPWLLPPCIPTITHPRPITLPHEMLAITLLTSLEREELFFLIEKYLGRVYKGLLPACELFEKNDAGGVISAFTRLTISQGKIKFDELIGILIVRKWNNYSIINSNEFIECIRESCLEADYEFKRQVSEILPTLFDLNFNEAKSIVGILRKDWDEKWHSDNRRRVIEALELILDREHSFIKEQIQIIEGDEIFTLIAITELLNLWRKKIDEREAEKMFREFVNEMKKFKHYDEDISTLKDFWKLLEIINLDIEKGLKKVESLCHHDNITLRICLARNLHHFYDEYPQKTIELIRYFLKDDQDMNVRRPIAKEKSLEFLISILPIEEFEKNAIELIWDLIKDEDSIIRITCFDYIERILQINKDLGNQIINYIISNEKNDILLERAKLWRHSLDFKNP